MCQQRIKRTFFVIWQHLLHILHITYDDFLNYGSFCNKLPFETEKFILEQPPLICRHRDSLCSPTKHSERKFFHNQATRLVQRMDNFAILDWNAVFSAATIYVLYAVLHRLKHHGSIKLSIGGCPRTCSSLYFSFINSFLKFFVPNLQ